MGSILSAISGVLSSILGGTSTSLSTIKEDGHINKPAALTTGALTTSTSATYTSGEMANQINLYENGLTGAAEQRYEERVEYTNEASATINSLSEEQLQKLYIQAKLLVADKEETEKPKVKTI